MDQLTIFDVFKIDYKESKINDALALIKSHAPQLKVAAVFIYLSPAAGLDFAIKKNGKYKIFSFWHGKLKMQNFILMDDLPNDDWIILR